VGEPTDFFPDHRPITPAHDPQHEAIQGE
jgi:hypothetical protein